MLVMYLDDILIMETSSRGCSQAATKARRVLESLGSVLNLEKCQFNYLREYEFIGFILDSDAYCIIQRVPREVAETNRQLF